MSDYYVPRGYLSIHDTVLKLLTARHRDLAVNMQTNERDLRALTAISARARLAVRVVFKDLRAAFAEGDILTKLQTRGGHQEPIPAKRWRADDAIQCMWADQISIEFGYSIAGLSGRVIVDSRSFDAWLSAVLAEQPSTRASEASRDATQLATVMPHQCRARSTDSPLLRQSCDLRPTISASAGVGESPTPSITTKIATNVAVTTRKRRRPSPRSLLTDALVEMHGAGKDIRTAHRGELHKLAIIQALPGATHGTSESTFDRALADAIDRIDTK